MFSSSSAAAVQVNLLLFKYAHPHHSHSHAYENDKIQKPGETFFLYCSPRSLKPHNRPNESKKKTKNVLFMTKYNTTFYAIAYLIEAW